MKFRGTYTHTVDGKGRVSMPAKFRKIFEENKEDLVIVPGYDDALYVFGEDAFEAWADSFFTQHGDEGEDGYDSRSSEHLDMAHQLWSSAGDVSIDSAGRIGIPAEMRQLAGIEKTALILGLRDHVEIWNPDRHAEIYGEGKSLNDFLRKS